MPIEFETDRWERVKRDHDAWWVGRLKRPLIQVRISNARDPGRPEPALPYLRYASHYDLAVPANSIVDRWDYELSKEEWLGDAFPAIWPNFGPGAAAAFLGCDLLNGNDTSWFQPRVAKPVADLHLTADLDNVWFRRVADLCRAATERWQGRVQVGMTDLGGALDILSSFRPSEQLLLDLYDEPDHVQRLVREIHDAWWRYFDLLNDILKPTNPGYTAWTPIFSAAPYYMLQCDFAYMIGPDMFREFALPELARSSARLTNAFYHLDGKGQLPHLDALLGIAELRGIQWVPGAGAPKEDQWPEVYQAILDSGKRSQLGTSMDGFDRLVEAVGSAEGLVVMIHAKPEQRRQAEAFLEKYGVPA